MKPQKRTTASGKTTWVARYKDPDGKERSETFPTQREAKAFLQDQETDVRHGRWINPNETTTVADLVEDYINAGYEAGYPPG
ncbi:hypothetical protein [Corynebacterium uterequi]|uniref:Phage L5-like integrase N-terminal domain-containing protein n=1 Tax=Corynebacterium uterequi TaxID=1072256 RepID=A0A0G3HEL3_9CORY|nr:hypothetical protein [Corynebacterium uterequi]AKK11781.1 hypothetical protein CUTER_09020 [Corynebacterium uterequi]